VATVHEVDEKKLGNARVSSDAEAENWMSLLLRRLLLLHLHLGTASTPASRAVQGKRIEEDLAGWFAAMSISHIKGKRIEESLSSLLAIGSHRKTKGKTVEKALPCWLTAR